MKHFAWVAPLLAVVFFVAYATTYAAQDNVPCTFTVQSLEALSRAINSARSSDAIRTELALRKELLSNTIMCLTKEVDEARTLIEKSDIKNTSAETVRKNLIAALDDATRYYQSENEHIPDSGIQGAKDIARNIREWRTNTFLPQQERIRLFVTWANNENLLATAEHRLNELQRGVQLLKVVDQTEIQSLFDDATTSFHSAQSFHEKAKNTLANNDDPSSFIKLSLESLAHTYQTFIKLGDSINTILPQKK